MQRIETEQPYPGTVTVEGLAETRRSTKIGRVIIPGEIVRKWLQFPNARITNVCLGEFPDELIFILADEEMPEVPDGGVIPDVSLVFTTHEDEMGNSVVVREKPQVKRENDELVC